MSSTEVDLASFGEKERQSFFSLSRREDGEGISDRYLCSKFVILWRLDPFDGHDPCRSGFWSSILFLASRRDALLSSHTLLTAKAINRERGSKRAIHSGEQGTKSFYVIWSLKMSRGFSKTVEDEVWEVTRDQSRKRTCLGGLESLDSLYGI